MQHAPGLLYLSPIFLVFFLEALNLPPIPSPLSIVPGLVQDLSRFFDLLGNPLVLGTGVAQLSPPLGGPIPPPRCPPPKTIRGLSLDPSLRPAPPIGGFWNFVLDGLFLLNSIPIALRYFCGIVGKMDHPRIVHPFIYLGMGQGHG